MLVGLLLAVSLFWAGAAAWTGKAPVIELSDSFAELNHASMNDSWFIVFYSPSCGHCKRLEPAFEEAALRLAKGRSSVHVAKIDATVNKVAADKFGVSGYPTIVLITKGQVHHYGGDRSVDSLLSFVDRMTAEVITKIQTEKELGRVLKRITKTSAFLYVGDKSAKSNDLFADFQKMAERRRAFNRFYLVPKPAVFEKFGFKVFRNPTVYAAKSKDDFEEFYPSKDKFSLPFDQWIISERFAIVSQFSTYDGYAARDIQKLVIMLLVKEKPTDEQIEIMTRAARTARGRRFVFAWTNDTETHSRLVGWFVRPTSLLCMNLTDMTYYDPADQHVGVDASEHQKLHPNHQYSTSATAIETFNKLTDFIEWVDIIRYTPDHRHLLDNMIRGGQGFPMRMKRIFFTIVEFCVTVYNESVLLFILFFGLPTGLFSLLFYMLCCTGDHDEAARYDDMGSDIDDDEDLIDDERAAFSREMEEGAGFEEGELLEDEGSGGDGQTTRRRAMVKNDADDSI